MDACTISLLAISTFATEYSVVRFFEFIYLISICHNNALVKYSDTCSNNIKDD